MTTTEPSTTESIRDRLAADHVRLSALFEDVLRRLALDDRDETRAAWSEFEHGLTAHLDAEDALMLPAFAESEPEEAAAIRAEHEKIRAKLLELGVAVDLHFIRADIAADFVQQLREHAAREDAMMYRWAETHLEGAVRGTIVRKLWTV
jgi:hemerythrin-like domain-containing protein